MELVPYVLVGAFVLGMLVIAITRRGKNLVEALPVIPGEALIEEREVRHSSFPRRAALKTSLFFAPGRLRVTTERLILTQPALGTGTQVVRYVILRKGGEPSWRDGYVTFALDPARSGIDEAGDLRLYPLGDPMITPAYVVVRGAGLDRILGS